MKQTIFAAILVATSCLFSGTSVGFLGLEMQRADTSSLEEQCWTIIKDALETGDPGEGVAAVEALSISRTEKGNTLLRQALHARWSNVRARAVRAVAEMAQLRSEPLPLRKFKRLLEGDDLDVQMQTAQALGGSRDAAAIDLLAPALQAETKYLREVTFLSLVRLGKKERAAAATLLLSLLGSRDEEVLKSAVRALGQVGGAEAIPPLEEALRNQSPEVRFEAALALTRLGDGSAIDVVRAGSSSSDPAKRFDSIVALYEFGDPAYLKALEQDLQSRDLEQRVIAASALQRIATDGEQPKVGVMLLLRRALADPHSGVRRRAVKTLVEVLDRENVELLKSKLTDSDEWVRVMAAKGLIQHVGPQGNESAVTILREGLDSDSDAVRRIALEGLAATGSKEFAALFREALKDSSLHVSLTAMDALVQINDRSSGSTLIELLKSVGDQSLKAAATKAAVRLGGPEDVTKFRPLLEKGKYGKYTRIYAAGAIIRLLHS